jgi:predicted nuclease of predicted toxin-antitoxin system
VLVTADYDFGELVIRLRQPAHGVVNLALGDLAATTRADIAVRRFRELGDRLVGNFVTIEPARIRIRPLPPSGS